MKANELRINNWVKCKCPDFEEEDVQLENIHPKGTVIDDYPYSISELQPIPLTEEWLIKMGFENVYLGVKLWKHSRNNGKHICFVYFDNNLYLAVDNEPSFEIIQYVHQLQNLYFALTNEELTITQ